MQAQVARELRVKGGREQGCTLDEDRVAAMTREYARVGADLDDARRADEDRVEVGTSVELYRAREGVDLPTVGVALEGRVEQAEVHVADGCCACTGSSPEQDGARAGTEEHELSAGEALAQRLLEIEELHEVVNRRRLPPGQDQVRELRESFPLAHGDGLVTEPSQTLKMGLR